MILQRALPAAADEPSQRVQGQRSSAGAGQECLPLRLPLLLSVATIADTISVAIIIGGYYDGCYYYCGYYHGGDCFGALPLSAEQCQREASFHFRVQILLARYRTVRTVPRSTEQYHPVPPITAKSRRLWEYSPAPVIHHFSPLITYSPRAWSRLVATLVTILLPSGQASILVIHPIISSEPKHCLSATPKQKHKIPWPPPPEPHQKLK